MNHQTKTAICYAFAMAAGGFTSSQLTLPALQKAAVVGLVTGGVMMILLVLLGSRITK